MRWDEIIIGGAAVIWGILLLVMRPEILKSAREGGKGLRNPRVLDILLKAAIVLLPTSGLAVILVRGLL